MKRSNNVLRFIYLISLIAVSLVVINVFLVSVFKVHIRSNTKLDSYVQNVSVVSETVHAKRGNIFSAGGEVVAQDERTYDVICYLSKTRTKANNEPAYVVDPLFTSQILSIVLDGDQQEIYYNLTSNPNLYQTEIGLAGRNITQEQKDAIESYELPGIGFRSSFNRKYPQGAAFAPYLIGFAQSDEDGKLVGKMGLESYLNSELSGIDGYHIYQQDKNGYILTGMYEETQEAENGYDVYTTIDASIQDALVASFDDLAEGAGDSWGSVVEIDTGKILAWAQKPTFDPNLLNIESYNNLGAQLPYEPGSVFKSFIYAAAMEEGVYNGDATYDSGKFCYLSEGNEPYRTYSGTNYGCISNANGKDWGMIPLDYGLIFSSNVATSTLLTNYLGSEKYYEYVKKFGFFNEVDTDGLAEDPGYSNFTYPSEKLSLTYGQGSAVTMLQLLQGYTAIFGNGEIVKPYYIDKIVDTDNDKVIYQGSRTVVDRVISEETAKNMQDLLYRVVYDARGTASIYKVDEVEILAKTGTAEAIQNGEYGRDTYVNSVMLAFPADNPKYMIYYAYVYPYDYGNVDNTGAIKNLIRKVALLTNVNYDSSSSLSTEIIRYDMPNVLSNTVDEAKDTLNSLGCEVYVIGDGNKVTKQYPQYKENVYTNQKVFLYTNNGDTLLPDFDGWTRKELISYWNISGLAFNFDGYGVAYEQSLPAGSLVNGGNDITVYFRQIDSYVDTKIEPEIEEIPEVETDE
ncbi:MAG: penicillin-binding protein [Erysipelotrichaceae bacterium]|nr:penicillin-binding protein [Erysipelotrichaceae bacterium]